MQASRVWTADTKIVELGGDGALRRPLVSGGSERYLCVVRSERQRRRIVARDPALESYVVVSPQRNIVRCNNADVLLIGPAAATGTLRFRNLRHAQSVALACRFDVRLLLAFAACCLHWLLGRLASPRIPSLDETGATARLVVFDVRRRRLPAGARHYIPHRLGIEGLLKRLTADGTRYAVLRWFEALPELPPGEDLDLLVADDDLEQVLGTLDAAPGVQPCDVYSESGLPRSDFRKMPYFPPRLAKALLDDTVVHNGLARVPRKETHFLSLVYHALYHKGPASGIPEPQQPDRSGAHAEHDYTQILRQAADELGLDVAITRDALVELLAERQWQPPRDMLLRLGKRNRWVRQWQTPEPASAESRGLVVFLLRQEGMHRGGTAKLEELLTRIGFSIIQTKVLSDAELRHVANNIRGGNWGRGPWPTSGGPPAAVVVAFDPIPRTLSRRERRKFPLADNARVLKKSEIRDAFNAGLPAEQHCNVVHSSDNSAEAWEYIATAMPEAEADIRRQLNAPENSKLNDAPVLRDLTRYGVRARVELIEHRGRLAVRKTFKPGCERFCRREELALRELSGRVPQIPPLWAVDARTVILPFYDECHRYERSSGYLMPIDLAQQAIEALRQVYLQGYALVDAYVDNLIIDRREGLKLTDFEFLYRYDERPASFEQSYDIAGVPADFQGDLPAGGAKNYRRHWQPYTGLSLDSLLHDPRWLQHVKRTLYVGTHPLRYFPRRVRHLVRRLMNVWRSSAGQPDIALPHDSPSQPRELSRAA